MNVLQIPTSTTRWRALRDRGYIGPIDQDGYASRLDGIGIHARIVRLSEAEIQQHMLDSADDEGE